jgi:tRNA (adenine37-N6)-methyltransferase
LPYPAAILLFSAKEKPMRPFYAPLLVVTLLIIATVAAIKSVAPVRAADDEPIVEKQFMVHPIGWVRKADGRTTIVVDKKYQPGLLGLDQFSHVWVLYWFDRNDTPQKRSILQVHPGGNEKNPIRGVFATHSPVRPNLIAMTRCKIISVKDNIIEIESIDAFPDTPVLDLKN